MQYVFPTLSTECLDINWFRINNVFVALQHKDRRLLKRNILLIVYKGVSK